MKLYLVQHGEAVSEAVDGGRPLSPKGLRDAASLAAACRSFGLEAAEVLHSGKLRARQTAEALADALGLPLREVAGIDPLSPVAPFARECAARTGAAIVVGHLPFMDRLAALLVAGQEEPSVVAFQNAGMLCLEPARPVSDAAPYGVWRILWTAFPAQPRMGA